MMLTRTARMITTVMIMVPPQQANHDDERAMTKVYLYLHERSRKNMIAS